MKKIVSAVALTALAFSAFAADLKITSDIKFQPVVATWTIPSKGDTVQKYVDIPDAVKDTVVIQLTEGPVAAYGKFDFSTSKVSVNTAYAKVGIGAANLWAFYSDSRYTNRVTADQNDLSFIESNYSAGTGTTFFGKLGVNNKSTLLKLNGNVGVDVDGPGLLQSSKKPAFVADYTLADALPGLLLFKVAAKYNPRTDASVAWSLVTGDGKTKATKTSEYYDSDGDAVKEGDRLTKGELYYNKKTTASGGSHWKKVPAAFTFEVAYAQDGLGALDVIANIDADKEASFAGFFNANNTLVSGLNTTVGFTYGFQNRDSDNKITNMAADFRARYVVNDQLSAGLYANWTSSKKGSGDATGLVSAVLNATYKLNSAFTPFFEAGVNLLTNSDTRKTNGTQIGAQVGGVIVPATGAKITTAVQLGLNGLGADADSAKSTVISIPLTLHVTL